MQHNIGSRLGYLISETRDLQFFNDHPYEIVRQKYQYLMKNKCGKTTAIKTATHIFDAPKQTAQKSSNGPIVSHSKGLDIDWQYHWNIKSCYA